MDDLSYVKSMRQTISIGSLRKGKDLRTIIRLESVRWANRERAHEIKYYLSSLAPEAEKLARLIRGHWGVENQCHWVLDVVFEEDQSSITEGHAPENLRIINLLAVRMLKGKKPAKKVLKLSSSRQL
jgi:predicted transposase YbfD/YdcC